ncbi:MAG: arsD [Herbinix sp.]|jgi:hypothetical protein|nr:arsD [Herbinix sp.]
MKSMQIYEPAMCCSTGLCGVGVDPELLRISTVLNTLEKNGVNVERYNLTSAPQEFIKNKAVNTAINEQGMDVLPLTVLDNEIIITGRYPTNDEFVQYFNIPLSVISECAQEEETEECGCCCSGEDCCDESCC